MHQAAIADGSSVSTRRPLSLDEADEKSRLIANIVGHMKAVTREEIKRRQVELFSKCDPDYGNRVAAGLGLTVSVK